MNRSLHNKLENICSEIAEYTKSNFKDFFVIYFGSFKRQVATEKSDLDIMCFIDDYTEKELNDFVFFFKNLCVANKLSIETQIPYENSLLINYNFLKKSIEGRGFDRKNEELIIPHRINSREFYCSDRMKYRFVFNAITTCSSLIAGNEILYKKWQKKGIINLIGYLYIIYKRQSFNLEEIVEFSIYNKEQRRSEGSFLGYKNNQILKDHLRNNYLLAFDYLIRKKIIMKNETQYILIDASWIKELMKTGRII